MGSYRNLMLYKNAYKLSMEIFEISKTFPKEEKYSLTDQVRRSSRSVCTNFGEAYCKRRYPAHFINKLTDCDAENTETGIWLQFALDCNYIDQKIYDDLYAKMEVVGKLIGYMIQNPGKFL